MRAIVTGSAGFVGRHVVNELLDRGYAVLTMDLLDNVTSTDAVKWFRDTVKARFDYDLLVHCAYRVGGRAAIDGTNLNLAENLMLDASMFRWAAKSERVGHVLYFSSSAVYPVCLQGTSRHRLIEPDSLIRDPDADYGWAKMNGERLAEMARANGVSVSVVRPFSGYGADQSGDYPFTSIVRRAMAGDLTVWGPPGQTRDWIHISDVVKGSLAVVDAQRFERGNTEPVNICTGRGTEMGELAKLAWHFANNSYDPQYWDVPPVLQYDETKPTGVFYRVGDPTRFFGYYRPRVTLEEGIREAIERYR